MVGSEDSHGRAIQALGALLADPPDARLVVPARRLLDRAILAARRLRGLRPRAYVVLGCAAALGAGPDPAVRETLAGLAAGLAEVVAGAPARIGWPWPEAVVTYDNGAIPAALFAAGLRLHRPDWVEQGCRLLTWLVGPQTSPDGHLTPIGNEGWRLIDGEPARFDQQPLEAAGLLEAARLAHAATHQARWIALMERCYAWFLGANDLGVMLADPDDGSCRDGLRRTGANPNRGAESALAWLLAVERIRALRAAQEIEARDAAAWTPRDEGAAFAGGTATGTHAAIPMASMAGRGSGS